MKILICDDDHMTIRALEFQFKRNGFEVIKAFDGRDALKILNEIEDFDVMITDVYMPYINGLEIVTHVRKVLHRIFPIIVVSRVNLDHQIEQAFELGANAYASKPINLEELSEKVNRLLSENLSNE